MTTPTGGTPAPGAGGTPEANAADAAEAAQWAALKEEIEGTEEGDEGEPEVEAGKKVVAAEDDPPELEAAAEEESEEEAEEPDDSRLTPEQLRANNKNLNAALREARAAQKRDSEQLSGITQLIARLREGRAPEQKTVEVEAARPKTAAEMFAELAKVDADEDPVAYLKAATLANMTAFKELQQGGQQTRQQMQAQAAEQQFWGTVQLSEKDILDAASPNHKADYWEACKHLEGQRRAELAVLYPDKAKQVQAYAHQHGFESVAQLREAILEQDRQAVARQALEQDRSPAMAYYETAVARGYKPAAAAAARQQLKGGERGKAQIAAMKGGLKASKTLAGGTGSSGADNELNVDDLVALVLEDPAAFDKEWDKMAAQQRG